MLRSNNCAGGTNGVAVSTVNSGGASGDAWDFVGAANGTDDYSSAQAASGSLSQRFSINAAPSGVNRCGWSYSAVTVVYGRCYLYRSAFPPTTGQLFATASLSGVGACGFFDINTSGQIRCWDSISASITFTTPLVLNAWNRVEWRIVMNAGAGICEARLYLGHSPTLIETKSLTGAQTRAAADEFSFGENWSSDGGDFFFMDDFHINDSGFPGPSVVSNPAYVMPILGRGATWMQGVREGWRRTRSGILVPELA